nr:immunoglobulin heavy chain junction region [Mus musculus]NSM03810.1 immunoglobulin heavy chain junction region [Mus musculus]NSM05527.1 immunoglobulin heavy chain junction region [Mus musculus]NSM05992.1 immunoglobulin heavy chain junction region [Mus musculus]NSM08374.1 immunoglobulin heavy chain junction region [Mus musculus]
CARSTLYYFDYW